MNAPEDARAGISTGFSTGPLAAKAKFVHDFVAAWAKVMETDRFDLA